MCQHAPFSREPAILAMDQASLLSLLATVIGASPRASQTHN